MCLHSVTWNSPLPKHYWQITVINQILNDINLLFNATGNSWSQTWCFEYFEFEFSERSIANGCDCSLTAGNTHRLTHVWTHVCCPKRSTVLMLASPPSATYFHTHILVYFHLACAYCRWMDEMLHKADRPYSIPLYKLPDYPLLNNVLITTFTIDSLEFLKSTPKAKIRIRLYHIFPNRGFQFPFFFSSTIGECCPQCPSPAMALWCIKVHPYIFPSNGYTISFQAQ